MTASRCRLCRSEEAPNSHSRIFETLRIEGIPIMTDGYGNGHSLGYFWVSMGIDGYPWVSMGILCFCQCRSQRLLLPREIWRSSPSAKAEETNGSRLHKGTRNPEQIPTRSRDRSREYPDLIRSESRACSGSSRDLGL